ncbi:MAG: class I SAM-dependent methyltransferase [Cellvibrionales bacterium]|nr:class I SAM-dependent methyltransferase [Cellvibrionales bacterium]
MKDSYEENTIQDYAIQCESFWEATKSHDVSQNIHALLSHLPKKKPLSILDLGCGPGRDLLAFKTLGHHPLGVDGAFEFCQMAKKHSGCPVINARFASLHLAYESVDGIFANASLFHLPSNYYQEFLARCANWLRPGGALMMSLPRGNFEGVRNQRYVNLMEFSQVKNLLEQAGLEVVSHYYRPAGRPLDQQPWLAVVSQKLV